MLKIVNCTGCAWPIELELIFSFYKWRKLVQL